MNAIKAVRKHLENDSKSESSCALARLVVSLAEEQPYSLAELYRLDYRAFVLAMDLLKEWRLARNYAARMRLYDVVVNEVGLTDTQLGAYAAEVNHADP
jgi:hypothetical protein